MFALTACSNNSLGDALSQRTLGEYNNDALDLTLSIAPGLIETRDGGAEARRVSAWTPTGAAQVTIRTGSRAQGAFAVELRNLYPNSTLRAPRARRITPLEALGEECVEEDFPPLDITCAERSNHSLCAPINSASASTSIVSSFSFTLRPCIELTYETIDVDERIERPLSFLVLGSTRSIEALRAVHERERELGQAHDFYLLLGNNLDRADTSLLDDLKALILELDVVTIITPGSEEVGDDEGQRFEQTFGPFDFRWTIKQTQFVSFYSADRDISARSIGTLQSSLRSMQSEEQQWRRRNMPDTLFMDRALPAFAVTHTPLFDPNGPREAGFQSRLQASRVASLLTGAGIHMLFAGNILDNAHDMTSSPELLLTASQDTRINGDLAMYRRITILDEPTQETIPVAQKHMLIESFPVPQ